MEHLGPTMRHLIEHKLGIMRHRGTMVISNQSAEFLDQVRQIAMEMQLVKQGLVVFANKCTSLPVEGLVQFNDKLKFKLSLLGEHQLANVHAAVTAIMQVRHRLQIVDEHIVKGIESTRWPGRLQWCDTLEYGRVLVDGAHNEQACLALADYVRSLKPPLPTAWIFGCTANKNAKQLLDLLVASGDTVLAVPFSQPAGMPWIECKQPDLIVEQY